MPTPRSRTKEKPVDDPKQDFQDTEPASMLVNGQQQVDDAPPPDAPPPERPAEGAEEPAAELEPDPAPEPEQAASPVEVDQTVDRKTALLNQIDLHEAEIEALGPEHGRAVMLASVVARLRDEVQAISEPDEPPEAQA